MDGSCTLLVCLICWLWNIGSAKPEKVIENLIITDRQERLAESAKLSDWGSAAYYNFHLTYDSPSNFAFAALGHRDEQPWKHRIRMLALEGQIYERDVGNPSLALIGRFDFSFLASFVLPLILIVLLYDLRASERTAGRYNLLESTAAWPASIWQLRALIRVGAVSICLLAPLVFAGWFAGADFLTLLSASAIVLAYAIFWSLVCYCFSARRKSGTVILMTLIGIWAFTSVVIPASARLIVDRTVPLPSGADILMLQREAVNDAWDLPKDATMKPFFERHPQWAHYQPEKSAFEWQWFFAFQQVGDQKTEQLANAYRDGRLQRDHIAAWVSLMAPASLLERSLQALANTDVNASIRYEHEVRAFHRKLREYYYPKFFNHEVFDRAGLERLPEFASGK